MHAERRTATEADAACDVRGVDAAVAGLAGQQHGVVSRAQLRALGLDRGGIDHRIRAGRLIVLHRGVYAVGHGAIGAVGRVRAALLAAGPGAVASHVTAAELYGLLPRTAGPVHVTVAGRRPRSRPGIAMHVARDVEVRRHGGLPLTTPERTLADLRGLLPAGVVERARAEAEARRLVPGPAGQDGATRSALERRLLRLVRDAGLPRPRVNVRVAGHEVDLLWLEQRLVVEADGRAAHGHSAAFERDRARDGDLTAAGYRVVRVTHRQLTAEPLRVVARLAAALLPATVPAA